MEETNYVYNVDAPTLSELKENQFHIGDIITVITNVLLSPYKDKADGIIRLLSYMVDENVYEFQLMRVVEECRPELLKQFPEFAGLAEIFGDKVNSDNWFLVLNELVDEFGGWRFVEKLDPSLHVKLDATEEAWQIAREQGFAGEIEPFIEEQKALMLLKEEENQEDEDNDDYPVEVYDSSWYDRYKANNFKG